MSTDSSSKTQNSIESLGSRLKAAGQLAARQAQRTKLVTLTLPAAYKSLGRHLYGTKAFRDEFPQHYQEFDRLAADIRTIKSQAEARPMMDGFTAKAKGAASAAMDMAQTKTLEIRINQAFGRFGESVFAQHRKESGPPEIVKPIEDAQSQLATLDAEIRQLSQSKTIRGIWENPIIIAILLIPCFPVGLWLVWRHPMWSRSRKLAWTSVWTGVMLIGVVASIAQERAARKALADANQLWETDQRTEAVAQYRSIVSDDWRGISDPDIHSIVYRRLIDYDIEHSAKDEARQFAQKASDEGLVLPLETEAGKKFLAELDNEKTTGTDADSKQYSGVEEKPAKQRTNKDTNDDSKQDSGITYESLSDLTVSQLTDRFGEPETFLVKYHANMGVLAWNAGKDKYLAILVIRRLDGAEGQDIVQPVKKLMTRSQLEDFVAKVNDAGSQ